MVYTLVLEASAERIESSSLSWGTKFKRITLIAMCNYALAYGHYLEFVLSEARFPLIQIDVVSVVMVATNPVKIVVRVRFPSFHPIIIIWYDGRVWSNATDCKSVKPSVQIGFVSP